MPSKMTAWRRANPEKYATYRSDNREKSIAAAAKWYEDNKEYADDRRLKKTYGISLEQKQQLLESQGHQCAICQGSNPTHVDHCHETGVVRGILCRECNIGLGLFKDNSKSLQKAIEYLKNGR